MATKVLLGLLLTVWLQTCTQAASNVGQCQFPFKYREHTYWECITDYTNYPWCSTISEFPPGDKNWIRCQLEGKPEGSTKNRQCQFPFRYKNIDFKDCTEFDGKDPWCGFKRNISENALSVDWGYCIDVYPYPDTTTKQCFDRKRATTGINAQTIENKVSYTAIKCNDKCGRDVNCKAYTYNYLTEQCTTFRTVPTQTADTWSDLFIVLDCSKTTDMTTPSTSARPTGTPVVCWDEYKNQRSDNGQREGTTNNELKKCQDLCASRPACVAIDFNINADEPYKCWTHTVTTITQSIRDPNVVQYKKRDCAATVVTTLECDPWAVENDKSTQKGTPQPNSNTVQQCKDYCLGQATCYGFDWNGGGQQGYKCWVHSDSTFTKNNAPTPGVNQYSKTSCVTGVTATATTPPCTVKWTETKGQNAKGGKEIKNMDTVAKCKAECEKMPECVAIDFNTIDNTCWWHNKDTAKDLETSQSKVNHYVKGEDCEDCPTMKLYEGTGSYGGTEQPNVKTLSACQSNCKATTSCYAIDWDKSSSASIKCYMHMKAGHTSDTYQNTNVDQYRVDRSCETCTMRFEEKKNQGSLNGVKNSCNSVDNCKTACWSDSSCLGFDWNINDKEGWWHTSQSNMKDTYEDTNVIQYIKGTCDTTATATAQPTDCAKFDKKSDTSTIGGKHMPDDDDNLDKCKTACWDEPKCYGIDWAADSTKKCWFHEDAKFADDAKTTSGVDQYRKNKDGCPTDCAQFTEKTGTSTIGGTKKSYQTLDTCKDACWKDDACYGFDYNPKTDDKCYFHTDAKFADNAKSTSGVDQYRKNKDCPTDCFSVAQDTGSPDGKQKDDYDTLEKCKDACILDTNCYGFDWNSKGTPACWFHTDPKFHDNAESNRKDITQYYDKKANCKADCTYTYIEVKNTGSPGGTEKDNLKNLDDCKSNCLSDSACYGLDYNGGCWWHLDEDYTKNTYSSTTVTQYRKQCTDTTGTATATATPTAVCTDSYTKADGKSSDGASRDTGATSVAACKIACSAKSECVGFDFNTGNNQCWLHDDKDKFAASKTTSNVDQYTREKCTKVWCQFTKYEGTYARDGLEQNPSLDTVPECKQACYDSSKCVAFDFNNRAKSCWFHESDDYLDKVSQSPEVEHYRKACKECKDSFTEHKDTSSKGGVEESSTYNTADICKTACRINGSCVGVDFNTNDKKCYFHLHKNFENEASSSSGTTQYRRVACEECAEKFVAYPNVASDGAETKGKKTVAECETECKNQEGCQAFDYNNKDGECWIHKGTDYAKKENQRTDDNVTQYRLECPSATATATATPTGCVDGYTKTAKKQTHVGVEDSGAKDLDDCQARCSEDSDCVAVDWDRSDNSCWRISEEEFTLYDNDNVDNHKRVKCEECQDTYEMRANRHTEGATEKTGVDSVDECKKACSATTYCKSFDWDRNSKSCWLANKTELYDTSTVDNYLRKKCDECDSFTTHTDKGSPDGSLDENQDDVEKCKAACLKKDDCYGFDFSTNNKQCWIHTSSNFADKAVTRKDVTQYRRKMCPTTSTVQPTGCADSYKLTENKQTYDGKRFEGADTVAECKTACSDQSDCESFDFDVPKNQCWLVTKSDPTLYDNDDTDHYVRTKGDCGCEDTYKKTDKKNVDGGRSQSGVTDVAGCKSKCNADKDCTGFDFDRNSSPACWLLLKDYKDSDMNDNDNVDNYRRQPCAECTDTFSILNDTHALDGKEMTETNLEKCKDECRAMSRDDCAAFDYNPDDPSCWSHKSGTLDLKSRTGVYQFQRQNCEEGTVTASTATLDECTDTFKVTKDMHGLGGDEVTGATTVDKCKDECRKNDKCEAFDFNTQAKSCYVFTTKDYTKAEMGQVDHYVRERKCADTPTPSPGCIKWIEYKRKQGYGGVEDKDPDTVTECRKACEDAGDRCVAIDYVASTKGCFLFSENATLIVDNPDISHHYKDTRGCECQDTFRKREGYHVEFGTEERGVTSVKTCEDRCKARNECEGFDWDDTANVMCWLILRTYDDEDLKRNSDVDNYKKERCGVTKPTASPTPESDCMMIEKNNMHAKDGISGEEVSSSFFDLTTAEGCRDHCLHTQKCISVDFNKASKICYMHVTSHGGREDTCCIRYEKYCNGCRKEFVHYPNKQGAFGTSYPAGDGLRDLCALKCYDDGSCKAIDYNRGNKACFFHYRTDISLAENTAVDHFKLEEVCPGKSTTTTTREYCVWYSLLVKSRQMSAV